MRKLFLNEVSRIFLLSLFILTSVDVVWAQEWKLSSISDRMLENADVVIRSYDRKISIGHDGKAEISDEIVISILKDHKDGYYYTSYWKDSFIKVKSLQLSLFDKNGKAKKKIKKKEFYDQAMVDNATLFSDNRILFYPIHEIEPPYSFKISAVFELDNLMQTPPWFPIISQNTSLEQSRFTIIHPEDKKIIYKQNLIANPATTEVDGQTQLQWDVSNIPAIHKLSNFDASIREIVPSVKWVPAQFEFGDAVGGYESWSSFAAWIDKLGYSVKDLPVAAKTDIHKLVNDEMSTKEKLSVVYEYLQNRSRYVSVQLGIGGWKPIPATEVHQNQYGDCKALSNYTQALLSELDIPSFYTIIHAGRADQDIVDPGFPSNQFNHAVLLVPVEDDTILMECTSQLDPLGFRSAFTDGRSALTINNGGGRLLKTPSYTLEQNYRIDSVALVIDKNGNSSLASSSNLAGITGGYYHQLRAPKENRLKWLSEFIHFGNFDIEEHDLWMQELEDWNYQLNLKTRLRSSTYVTKSGSRLFFSPGVFNYFWTEDLSDSVSYHFNIPRSAQYTVVAAISLPKNHSVESKLPNQSIDSEFIEYEIKCKSEPNISTLFITRSFKIKAGKYSKNDYLTYKKIMEDIYKIETRNIVIKNEE